MGVTPGYKQTEVEGIPKEWDSVAVQMLVDENILEKPLDGNHGNIHPKSNDFVDYGIPFVMANNVLCGQVDLLGCKFITKERAAKLQKALALIQIDPPVLTGIDPLKDRFVQAGCGEHSGWSGQGCMLS